MKNVLALIIDILVPAIAIGCLVYSFSIAGWGSSFFSYYTHLSNILAAIACLLTIPFDIRQLLGTSARLASSSPDKAPVLDGESVPEQLLKTHVGGGQTALPSWLRVLKLAGFATVMVTFATVFLILGFIAGHLNLLKGTNLFFHLISPLLILAVCIIQRTSFSLPRLSIAAPIGFTVIYGIVYFVEVLVIGEAAGGWRDIYSFNMGGMWPVSAAVVFAIATVVSLVCWKLSGGRAQSKNRRRAAK